MRSLLAAAFAVLGAVSPLGPLDQGPRTETLARSPGRISAFAQDGTLIAWFTPGGTSSCNRAHVRSLSNGITIHLPRQGAARNVTCRWNLTDAPRLAVAGTTSNVVWTLREPAPLPFDYLIGAGASDRRERRFHEIAHTNRGNGVWLGGVAGDGSSLVFAAAAVDYVDEAGCLAGTGSCAMQIAADGGGVFVLVGRQPPKLVAGTESAVGVAVSDTTVAYVPAAIDKKTSRPTAAADLPIEIVDVSSGAPVARVSPQGIPAALALSTRYLATLERAPTGLRLAWYDSSTGKPSGSVPIPVAAAPELSLSDRFAVYRVGRTIYSVDLTTSRVRTLVKTAGTPIGLSIEGGRIAWAENVKGRGRIRALYVR